MPPHSARLAAALAAVLSASACATHLASPGTSPTRAAYTPAGRDFEPDGFAHRVVTQSAHVREGELVVISGGPEDARLLEEIAAEVRRAGAFDLVRMTGDRLARSAAADGPERLDGRTPQWPLRLAELADVEIAVDSSQDEQLLADVPARRIAAQARAAVVVNQTLSRRGVRQVFVGNDLRPTADRARRYGVDVEDLARIYRAGLDADPDALEATGERLQMAFEQGRRVRLTDGHGTDLTFEVTGRTAYTSDGEISADDVGRGGAGLHTWLPAGEAYVTTVPGTAEGKVVIERDFTEGREFRNLVLTFHRGRLVSMNADSGDERLQSTYRAAGSGKDLFAGIDVGFNPGLAQPPGASMRTFAVAGTVAVAFGSDTWLGGDNDCGFGFSASLDGATLTVDGEPLVEDGKLAR
jgi:leucyl aminopeptidase (aminopeptidase T)